jgi:hypothetical protein
MKRLVFIIPIAVLISLLFVACRRDSSIDASKFTVEVIDGVRHIHNMAPQLGDASAVRLELIGKIGELEGKEGQDIFYDPVDAARLPNGDILILEGGGCSVKRYSKDHAFISSFGQKGLGPGDFISPYYLRLDGKRNRLYVADNKISWFSLDGRFIDSFKPAKARVGGSSITQQYRTSGMAVLSGSRVILPSDTSVWEDSREKRLFSVYDEGGTIIGSFGAVKPFDYPDMTLNANIVFFLVDSEDCTCVVYAFQNRVDKYLPDGTIVFSADRYLPYEIKNEMKELVFTSGPMKQALSVPSVTSVTKGISVDHKNRIWALTFLKEPDKFGSFGDEADLADCYEFHVFDSNGIFLFRVPFPNIRFDNFSIYDDRMYLIDSQHESCVYEFRIVERGEES